MQNKVIPLPKNRESPQLQVLVVSVPCPDLERRLLLIYQLFGYTGDSLQPLLDDSTSGDSEVQPA